MQQVAARTRHPIDDVGRHSVHVAIRKVVWRPREAVRAGGDADGVSVRVIPGRTRVVEVVAVAHVQHRRIAGVHPVETPRFAGEDRDGVGAARRQTRGELHGRQSLVERVERPRKQSRLLTRDDRDRVLRAQPLDVRERLRRSIPARVRLSERVGYRVTVCLVGFEHARAARRWVSTRKDFISPPTMLRVASGEYASDPGPAPPAP